VNKSADSGLGRTGDAAPGPALRLFWHLDEEGTSAVIPGLGRDRVPKRVQSTVPRENGLALFTSCGKSKANGLAANGLAANGLAASGGRANDPSVVVEFEGGAIELADRRYSDP
jgi:hypothetical protein